MLPSEGLLPAPRRWWQSSPAENRLAVALLASWVVHLLLLLPSSHGGQRPATLPLQVRLTAPQPPAETPKAVVASPDSPTDLSLTTPPEAPGPFRVASDSPPELPASAVPSARPETPASSFVPASDGLPLPWDQLAAAFYRAKDVDQRATPLSELTFDWSGMPQPNSPQVIELEALIDETGVVVAARSVRDDIPGVTDQALSKLRNTLFRPAEIAGRPVKYRIHFQLSIGDPRP